MTDNTINDAVTMAGNAEGTLLADRYRVVRQLGQGGMGSVWLAEDKQLDNKPFAIKMLPSILVLNKRAYRQLKDEALVAMKLVHPNIVQLRAFEENNGNPFLVMDYIDGETLDDYLAEKGKITEEETIRLLKPIAAALDYAHVEGVVHRDVKPANVMIRKDGHPFILDFGIAREMQETMTRVTGRLSSGTLLYMSPEQLNGMAPNPPQDVYSFAAMAYECLKGEPPFLRGQIEFQIINNQPPHLSGGPSSCAAAIMSGLAKKPEDRPATCSAVLVVGNQQTCYSQTENTQGKSDEGGSKKAIYTLLLLLCLALGGFIGYSTKDTSTKEVRGNTCIEDGVLKERNYDAETEKAQSEETAKPIEMNEEVTRLATAKAIRDATQRFKDVYNAGRYSEAAALKSSIDLNDKEVQFKIGSMYYNGFGVAQDSVEAAKWYRKAAEQGLAEAQSSLGSMYNNGDGVGRDSYNALNWYRKAAAQGDAEGQFHLGVAYDQGIGVKYNFSTAVDWWRKAAEQGHARAQYKLGWMYLHGFGYSRDYDEAVKWLRKAAEQGDKDAKKELMKMGRGL